MPLQPGDPAPDFALKNTSGEYRSLSEINEGNQVVLLFFPLAFSSVCRDELCRVRDNMKFYNSVNAQVVGISVDSFFTLRAFKKAENLNFTLLSDFNKEVSALYNSLEDQYYDMKGVSKRSVFVIGKNGRIKYLEILEDSGKQPDFKSVQKALINN